MFASTHPLPTEPTRVDPTEQIWGYMASEMRQDGSKDDGVFLWFRSLEEMLSVVSEPDPNQSATDEPQEADALLEKLRILTSVAQTPSEGAAGPSSDFGDGGSGQFGLRWWGAFRDLCTAETEWEGDLRRSFRSRVGASPASVGDPSGPIADSERDEFLGFLLHYRL